MFSTSRSHSIYLRIQIVNWLMTSFSYRYFLFLFSNNEHSFFFFFFKFKLGTLMQ